MHLEIENDFHFHILMPTSPLVKLNNTCKIRQYVVLYKSNNGLWSKTDTKHVNISKHFLYGDNFLDWLEKNKDLEKELYYVINKKGNA